MGDGQHPKQVKMQFKRTGRYTTEMPIIKKA